MSNKALQNLVIYQKDRSNRPEVFCKKGVLKNFTKFTGKFTKFTGKHLSLQACNFIKRETLAQVLFSCEFCENFKNTFFHRTHPVAASGRKNRKKNFWAPFILQLQMNK